MIQAIFYKEWIKTRWYLLLATLFMIGITGYSMLRVSRVIAMQGIDHLWVVMVQKDAIFVDLLQYVPLLTGILLAAVQFFPEMQRKCLKLTLHLPYSQKKMILAILAFGLLALAACFATSFIIMGIYLPQHFGRVGSAYSAVGSSVVSGRWCRLFVRGVDLSGTHMETPGAESDYCRIDLPHLLLGSGT